LGLSKQFGFYSVQGSWSLCLSQSVSSTTSTRSPNWSLYAINADA
jgi:hypothetical protein